MSRTYHTTPAFPRSLRGPRGGQIVAPTPCAECVAFAVCRPGDCSAPFGCDSWVDNDGRRVDVEADNARLLALADAHEPGRIPEGLTPEDWADMTPAERDTAEGIDGLTRLPDPGEDEAEVDATPCLECGGLSSECRPCGCPHVEPNPGPLFQR
jgi:hypothetical protein